MDDLDSFFGTTTPGPKDNPTQLTTTKGPRKAIKDDERAARRALIADEQRHFDDLLRLCPQKQLRCSGNPARSRACSFVLEAQIDEQLLPHQREGVRWLAERHWRGTGCVLADEMGLGKTVQIAAFVGSGMRSRIITSVVIVAPTTLISNWVSEMHRWGMAGDALVVVHGQPRKKREQLWRRLNYGTPFIAVTSYGLFKNDADIINGCTKTADYVILDEAQQIRNPSSEVSKVAQHVRAMHRVAVTGTPVMNSFVDLWSVMQFVDASVISESRTQFAGTDRDLMRGNERGCGVDDRRRAERKLDELKEKVGPYILRREKKDISELQSTKTDHVVWVRLAPAQESHYLEFIDSKEVRFGLQQIDTHHPLTLLTALKRICNHTWLNMTEANFQYAMQDPNSLPEELAHFGPIDSSAKISTAIAFLLHHGQQGHKTLVFSQSKRLLAILSFLLSDRHQLNHTIIDGDVPPCERQRLVDRFNTVSAAIESVCLLTTQVGGVGLTFNSATRVLLLDPSWNPAVDAQAVDRIHRIGQVADVATYRLVSCGTVEEKVYRNQIHKLMAAKQIVTSSAAAAVPLQRYFSHIQLRTMFEVGILDYSETAAQLTETHPELVPSDEFVTSVREKIPAVVSLSNHLSVFTPSGVKEAEIVEERRRTRVAAGARGRRRKQQQLHDEARSVVELPESSRNVADLLLGRPSAGEHATHLPSVDVAEDIDSVRLSVFSQPPDRFDGSTVNTDDVVDVEASVICFRGLRMAPLDLDCMGRLTLDAASIADCDDDEDDGADARGRHSSDHPFDGSEDVDYQDDDETEFIDWAALDRAAGELGNADDEAPTFSRQPTVNWSRAAVRLERTEHDVPTDIAPPSRASRRSSAIGVTGECPMPLTRSCASSSLCNTAAEDQPCGLGAKQRHRTSLSSATVANCGDAEKENADFHAAPRQTLFSKFSSAFSALARW